MGTATVAMPLKIRTSTKPSPSRVAKPLPGANSEAPTLKEAPPATAPRPARPVATVTGKEWRVDPLVAGLSLSAALLVGVVISSLLMMRVRPTAMPPAVPRNAATPAARQSERFVGGSGVSQASQSSAVIAPAETSPTPVSAEAMVIRASVATPAPRVNSTYYTQSRDRNLRKHEGRGHREKKKRYKREKHGDDDD